MIFSLETDPRGFLTVQHPMTEQAWKLETEVITTPYSLGKVCWYAYPVVETEDGDLEFGSEASHTNEDLYCLLETME